MFYLDSGNSNGGNEAHNVQYSSILMSGAEKMFLSESLTKAGLELVSPKLDARTQLLSLFLRYL